MKNWTRYFLYWSTVVGALSVACSNTAHASAIMDSTVLIDPPLLDFGHMYQHESTTQTVMLINLGPEEMILTRVGRTCPDCVSATFEPLRLLSGEAGTLTVVLNPEDHEGPLTQLVTVETAAGTTFGVPLRAQIVPTYQVSGAPFLMQVSPGEGTDHLTLHIVPTVPLLGTLTEAVHVHPMLEATVRPDHQASGAVFVDLALRGEVPDGLTGVVLEIVSSDPRDPPCRVYGAIFQAPPFYVYPRALYVAATDTEQLRMLFIEQRADPTLEILSIETPGEDIAWRTAPGFGLDHMRVNVYIRNQENADGHIGDIVLTVDDDEQSTFRVPVIVDAARAQNRAESIPRVVPVASRRGCGCPGDHE